MIKKKKTLYDISKTMHVNPRSTMLSMNNPPKGYYLYFDPSFTSLTEPNALRFGRFWNEPINEAWVWFVK